MLSQTRQGRPATWRQTIAGVLLALVAIAVVPGQRRVSAAEPATISFSLNFPNSDPDRYSITVNADGHAKYQCDAKISDDSEEREDYKFEFEFSPANRVRVFELAAQAKYFAGKIDSGNKKLAFTGAKTLSYQDGPTSHSADYNYSSIPAVQQLTTIFQSTSATLEHGRHLAYYLRYQKLALDAELKNTEAQAKGNELGELQALAPILQKIYDDASVMNVVRSRALRLIEMGKAEPLATR